MGEEKYEEENETLPFCWPTYVLLICAVGLPMGEVTLAPTTGDGDVLLQRSHPAKNT